MFKVRSAWIDGYALVDTDTPRDAVNWWLRENGHDARVSKVVQEDESIFYCLTTHVHRDSVHGAFCALEVGQLEEVLCAAQHTR